MNIETKHALHDLRSLIDQINTLYTCIVFDLKDKATYHDDDFNHLKKVIAEFDKNLNRIKEN